MPKYEMRCPACKLHYDIFIPLENYMTYPLECPECPSEVLTRVFNNAPSLGGLPTRKDSSDGRKKNK